MKWTEQEIDFLKKNYSQPIPLIEISKELNRTLKSVKRKAQDLHLHRKWIRFEKLLLKQSRGFIDKRYYEKNKKIVYQRKMDRRKRLKEEMVQIAGGKCSNCGYKKCLSALEFHHHQKNKEGNLSTFLKNESRQKLLKEAEKCILLCANCHRELHYNGRVG